MYSKHRIRELLDYIDGLPPTARLWAAQLEDPDLVAELAAQPEPSAEWAPTASQWTPTLAALARIHDLLAGYLGGEKASRFPVPRSPVAEARAERAAAVSADLISVLTPWAAP